MTGLEELCARSDVTESVLAALNAVAARREVYDYELLEAVHLTPQPFTVENELLTPTFDLRRPNLWTKFQGVVRYV